MNFLVNWAPVIINSLVFFWLGRRYERQRLYRWARLVSNKLLDSPSIEREIEGQQ